MSATTIEESEKGFEYWASREYITAETGEKIRRAPVLVIPDEGFRDRPGPVFPVRTEELFQLLRERLTGQA